jgi:hypothetical protein
MLNKSRPDYSTAEVSGTHPLNETMLRSEVLFWQELIESSSDALPPESVERMEQALELARSRLSALFEEYRRHEIAGSHDQSNVHYLRRPA